MLTSEQPEMDQPQAERQTEQQAQQEWDAIARERETGVPAAEKPQAKPAKPQPAEQPKPDPLQELRERFEKLEARTRNAEGHIGGLNHNQRLMQETLQAASKAATQKVSEAPTQAQVTEAMRDPEEWAALKQDFPEWSSATERLLEARLARLKSERTDPDAIARMVREQLSGQLNEHLSGQSAEQSAAVRKDIIDASLDAVYPEWQADVKTERFGAWLAAQAPEVQAMAQSSSVRDAAKMLGLYERAKQMDRANPAADIVAARRQKLANAAGTPKGVRVPPQRAESDMSKEELWNLEARRRDAARAKNI